MGIRRITRPDELPFVVRRSRRISKESSSRRIVRLVPVFILETHNQTNNKCLPKFVQTDNASSGIKAADGNQSMRENLVMTSAYANSYVHTDWQEGTK